MISILQEIRRMAGEPTDRRFWTVVFLASVDFCCILLATERYDKGDIKIGTAWLVAGVIFSLIGWKWPQIKRTIGTWFRKKPSKLVIHWANYRAVENGGEEFLVGDFLRQIISGDSLVFDIENHNFVIGDKNFVPRDPLSGKEKRLQVNYSYSGNPPVTTERREHGRLLLPEDSKIKWLMSEIDGLKSAQPPPLDLFKNPPKEIVSKREYTNEVVEMDGKSFRDCNFTNTKLMYHGIAPTELMGPTLFDKSVIVVTDNPALDLYARLNLLVTSAPGAEIKIGSDGQSKQHASATVPLRQRTIALCDDLSGFLAEHGPKPVSSGNFEEHLAAVIPWREKMGADFRLRFSDSVKRLRDEIQVHAGLSEPTLDNAICNAEKRVCDERAIDEIRQCLWKFAYSMNK